MCNDGGNCSVKNAIENGGSHLQVKSSYALIRRQLSPVEKDASRFEFPAFSVDKLKPTGT